MSKEATLQVRMESAIKADVEELYDSLGTSFAEAVRIFARQSLAVGGLPFVVQLKSPLSHSSFGAAHKYAKTDKRKREGEEGAWRRAAGKKQASRA